MDKERERILQLREELREHNRRYYALDDPIITDEEYDKLMHELKDLEQKHPELADSDSPSVKVGGFASSTFEKFSHKVQMQSLLDVFSFEEVEKFVKDVKADYPNATFSVEFKIDGLSISLTYDDGNLTMGATRGDGFIGEDVTENIRQIMDIPKKISCKGHNVFRGEVYMDKATLQRLNDKRLLDGEKLFANCRNAAAGTLRQLDPAEVKERGLKCFVFNMQEMSETFTNHLDSLAFAKNQGFSTVSRNAANNASEVIAHIEDIGNMRPKLSYDIDGAVIKVNEFNIREEMGETSKYPKWAVAYKYPPEEKSTIIRDIPIQVGRTGAITPKAIFDTVMLAGTNVSAATLHNFDIIKALDIRIGDTIIVHKSGDIIPKITKVIVEKRPENSVPFNVPTHCPECGHQLVKIEDEAVLKCVNSDCPAMFLRKVIHFVSKEAMNIDGMGKAVVEQLVDSGFVKKVTDIYSITKENLLTLDKVKDKKAKNLLDAIENSKKTTLNKVLYSLGIPLVGRKATTSMCKYYADDLDKILSATIEELSLIDDIGEKIAEAANTYFHNHEEFIRELVGIITLEKTAIVIVEESEYTGKTCVVTGSFEGHSRKDIEKRLEELGAKVSGSVSKKTDYLFCGEDAGSKLTKAQDLGIKILENLDTLF